MPSVSVNRGAQRGELVKLHWICSIPAPPIKSPVLKFCSIQAPPINCKSSIPAPYPPYHQPSKIQPTLPTPILLYLSNPAPPYHQSSKIQPTLPTPLLLQKLSQKLLRTKKLRKLGEKEYHKKHSRTLNTAMVCGSLGSSVEFRKMEIPLENRRARKARTAILAHQIYFRGTNNPITA